MLENVFRKCCVLFISTFCLLNYSCKSSDDEIPQSLDSRLMEIQMERGSEIIITEFSEDGRPISETNRSFIYDTNNQLIESVDEAGGVVLPTNYSYNNDLLVTYDFSVIGGSDGVSQVSTEISYEDTSVTRTAYHEGEIRWWQIYTFMSTDYKYLIRKEAIWAPNNVGVNELFEYDYDADFNLISVHHSEVDPNTGNVEFKYNYNFEYDNMKNPFERFINHNALVFGLLRFPFDSEPLVLLTATDPMVRRNGNHNITKVSQVNVNSGSTFDWIYEYVYNADGYPAEKMRIDQNGERIYNLTYSYY